MKLSRENAKEMLISLLTSQKVNISGQIIEIPDNLFFSTVHIKKDGSRRVTQARLGVDKDQKGYDLPYDALAKGLLTVYDVQKEGWSTVNLETLEEYTLKGTRYEVIS